MARRRGSVRELSRGRWEVTAPLGRDPLTGRHRKVSRVVHGKREDANRRLRALLVEVDEGEHAPVQVEPGVTTYGQLVERWLEARRAEGLSPTTCQRYAEAAVRLKRHFAGAKPDEVGAEALEALYGRMVGDGLSGATVRKLHQVARGVGDMAVRYGLTRVNAAAEARPPKIQAAVTDAPTASQVKLLIDAGLERNPVLGVMLALGAATGARRGELSALRWTDIDGPALKIQRALVLNGNELVERGTKTGQVRRVSLDAASAGRLVGLWHYQRAACLAAGGEPLPGGFIFAVQPDGSRPYRPDSITYWMRKLCQRTGISTTWYQATRHFHASELVAAGIDLRTIADRLGHSPQVLLTRYAHLRPGRDQAAADVAGALLA